MCFILVASYMYVRRHLELSLYFIVFMANFGLVVQGFRVFVILSLANVSFYESYLNIILVQNNQGICRILLTNVKDMFTFI